ncbi:MAG: CoB--CoM heterodisulfide reductase iron-sulfur subunit B family protein [Ignavibacteria bacterium]
MQVGYYPGCSQEGTAKEYDKSLRKVFNKLGVQIAEIDDWSCCGATSGHVTSHLLSLSLAARNLLLAKEQNLSKIFAPCAACYNRLAVSKFEVENNKIAKNEVENILGEALNNLPPVMNIVQLFQEIGIDKIVAKKVRNLKDLKVACYYGCLLVRPHKITNFDDPENPSSIEEIVEATGAQVVDWNFKVECCGAAHSVPKKDIVLELSKRIIDDAVEHGANVIVVVCPMCHTNLDMRQKAMKRLYNNHKEIPILYLSELVGLSLGFEPGDLGIDLHFIDFKVPLMQEEKVL